MNSLITILPLVLLLGINIIIQANFQAVANIILSISFVIIWAIAIWMLAKDYYTAGYLTLSDETLQALKIDKVTTALTEVPATWFSTLNSLLLFL
jgi:POT family proton-dependent oligopeptide transporter